MKRVTVTVTAAIIIAALFVGVAVDAAWPRAHRAHGRGYFTWLAISRFFAPQQRSLAYRIARCETGGTFSRFSKGSAGERGEFQIHPVHAGQYLRGVAGVPSMRVDFARLYEIVYNVRVAFLLSRGGADWQPWTCSRMV